MVNIAVRGIRGVSKAPTRDFLPARRYANTGTIAMALCLSVCLSVCHKSVFYQKE